jgi:hypothetical protein
MSAIVWWGVSPGDVCKSELRDGGRTKVPGVERKWTISCGLGEVGVRWPDCMMLAGYSHCSPALVQWPHSGCHSLHLILRRLQLKQPRRDLVCPFRGMGLRGCGGALSQVELPSGESLDDVSMLLLVGSRDRDMVEGGAYEAAESSLLWRYIRGP